MALKIVGIETGKFGYARKAFSQRPFNTHQEVTDDEDLMSFWHWDRCPQSPIFERLACCAFDGTDFVRREGQPDVFRVNDPATDKAIQEARMDDSCLPSGHAKSHDNEELHDQEPRSSSEIESDLRKTRGRMDAPLDELDDRLTARSFLNSALDWWESRSVSARSGGAAKDAYETVDLFPLSPNR